MTVRISAPSLGSVGPYLVLGSLVLSPVVQTGTTGVSIAETSFARAQQIYSTFDAGDFEVNCYFALDHPALVPSVILRSTPSQLEDFYEPFIISEGWREEDSLEGPFLVQEDQPPVVSIHPDGQRVTVALV
jgi:hypothetical protein